MKTINDLTKEVSKDDLENHEKVIYPDDFYKEMSISLKNIEKALKNNKSCMVELTKMKDFKEDIEKRFEWLKLLHQKHELIGVQGFIRKLIGSDCSVY